jgi:uncharacterized phage protein (TIGR01671 family)
MKREIKFRAKRIDNGGWVYGDLNQNPIHYECQIIENGVIHYSVDPSTVGQFTGLKDKNDNDIYEEDLLLVHEIMDRGDGKYDDGIIEVVVDDDSYFAGKGYDFYDYLWLIPDCKIIGNIHDNSELLEAAS